MECSWEGQKRSVGTQDAKREFPAPGHTGSDGRDGSRQHQGLHPTSLLFGSRLRSPCPPSPPLALRRVALLAAPCLSRVLAATAPCSRVLSWPPARSLRPAADLPTSPAYDICSPLSSWVWERSAPCAPQTRYRGRPSGPPDRKEPVRAGPNLLRRKRRAFGPFAQCSGGKPAAQRTDRCAWRCTSTPQWGLSDGCQRRLLPVPSCLGREASLPPTDRGNGGPAWHLDGHCQGRAAPSRPGAFEEGAPASCRPHPDPALPPGPTPGGLSATEAGPSLVSAEEQTPWGPAALPPPSSPPALAPRLPLKA
ncbi:wiskott-Aldrich syndrome protein homolog 1-like [Marmota marmota marmota]|uniref:wiskott-Aldrich syndrome protein homolog 1-like n=1 Tax=Marmota marmota marmota TaxID=9994 RepID=UPI00209341A4|nr:wiskott-Aldrich syndrome protein homolog 1-like [Marmota marmota marmota]